MGGIYLIQKDGSLLEFIKKGYLNEEELQKLLVDYPNLLAGDQMDEMQPRKWLLIRRELPIPDKEDTGGRWLLDHLFLDQDAIPTLVEVKRSNDTRIRREVVGQMLDYAANTVAYLPSDKIRKEFESRCDKDPQEVFADHFKDISYEQYWANLDKNLKTHTIRLVFVADEIPLELKRIVEFLNDQLKDAYVFAVEIKQYQGGELKTLVPRLIGNTAESEAKSPSRRSSWDWNKFDTAIKALPPDQVSIIEELYDWAGKQEGLFYITFGTGGVRGSYTIKIKGKTASIFSVFTDGSLQIQYGSLNINIDREKIKAFHDSHGINVSDDFSKYPVRPISEIFVGKPEAIKRFKDAVVKLAKASL